MAAKQLKASLSLCYRKAVVLLQRSSTAIDRVLSLLPSGLSACAPSTPATACRCNGTSTLTPESFASQMSSFYGDKIARPYVVLDAEGEPVQGRVDAPQVNDALLGEEQASCWVQRSERWMQGAALPSCLSLAGWPAF